MWLAGRGRRGGYSCEVTSRAARTLLAVTAPLAVLPGGSTAAAQAVRVWLRRGSERRRAHERPVHGHLRPVKSTAPVDVGTVILGPPLRGAGCAGAGTGVDATRGGIGRQVHGHLRRHARAPSSAPRTSSDRRRRSSCAGPAPAWTRPAGSTRAQAHGAAGGLGGHLSRASPDTGRPKSLRPRARRGELGTPRSRLCAAYPTRPPGGYSCEVTSRAARMWQA